MKFPLFLLFLGVCVMLVGCETTDDGEFLTAAEASALGYEVVNPQDLTGPVVDVKSDELTVKPRAMRHVPPDLMSRKNRRPSEVLMELIIDTEGVPTNIRVLESDNRAFTVAALKAIVQWRFSPGMVDGETVNVRVEMPMKFSIQ